jgi:type II secretory pathway pseudopilin PulG
MRTRTAQSGFTLLETLIYLALYSIIISGALAAIYSIFESSAHNQAQAMVQEEGSFLIGKIDWALSNTASVQSPASTGTDLAITKFDGTSVDINRNGQNMQYAENAGSPQTLNNSNIGVTDLQFVHAKATADGINPESIQATVTVAATSSDGRVFSRSFTTMKYLRK